jgi:tryptophan synthase alpha chain
MNRIDQLFNENPGEILSVYITAGFPELNDTPALLRSLQEYGAHMVEIGIPFSDPLADGPVIQRSSHIALQNGMNLKLLFSQLSGIRASVHIPLVLMGYLNPVLQMGMETFLQNCQDVGIDGVIIPDLPPDEYEACYLDLFQRFGICNSLLITPHTSPERIQKIARLSEGFLYMVADASTTGTKSAVGTHQIEYFKRIRKMNLPIPGLIGFGISNHDSFMTACKYARGAILGSAFIKAIGEEGPLEKKVEEFIHSIKGR